MSLKDRRLPTGPYVRTVNDTPPDANGNVDVAGGGGGGVTDHGALTGLADDDHPQYAKKASNLSDLGDAGTARANLGLRSFVHFLPWTWPADSTVGSWVRTAASSVLAYYQSSGAQNDSAIWSLPLQAGTYDLTMAYFSGINRGIATIEVDDGAGSFSTLTTVDQYAASGSDAVTKVTGLTISGAATYRQLRVKAATKNGSSSNYFLLIHAITLRQTT